MVTLPTVPARSLEATELTDSTTGVTRRDRGESAAVGRGSDRELEAVEDGRSRWRRL